MPNTYRGLHRECTHRERLGGGGQLHQRLLSWDYKHGNYFLCEMWISFLDSVRSDLMWPRILVCPLNPDICCSFSTNWRNQIKEWTFSKRKLNKNSTTIVRTVFRHYKKSTRKKAYRVVNIFFVSSSSFLITLKLPPYRHIFCLTF